MLRVETQRPLSQPKEGESVVFGAYMSSAVPCNKLHDTVCVTYANLECTCYCWGYRLFPKLGLHSLAFTVLSLGCLLCKRNAAMHGTNTPHMFLDFATLPPQLRYHWELARCVVEEHLRSGFVFMALFMLLSCRDTT